AMTSDTHSLIPHLDRLYEGNRRNHAVPSEKRFSHWQQTKRARVQKLLRLHPVGVVGTKKVGEKRPQGFSVEIWDFALSDGTIMPVWIGRPKQPGAFRPLIIYHGHC